MFSLNVNFCYHMSAYKYHLSSVLSKVSLAYKRKQLNVMYSSSASSDLMYLLHSLQTWGIISHFEANSAKVMMSSYSTKVLKFSLFLRYADQKPVISFWSFGSFSQAKHSLKYVDLHSLAWYQPGMFFVIKTDLGLMSLSDCLIKKLGGSMLLAVRAV